MKGYAMLKIGESGWIEKDRPACGPMDAICKPLAVAICTSDVHTLWEGAIGDRHNMILGHECCAEVVEVGSMVKDFKPGDRVLVPAITPDWNSLEAQAGYSMHSGGMLAGWKFSNFKDGVFSEYFHVNDADGNLALLPSNISPTDACMLSDMVPTGFHGVEMIAAKLKQYDAKNVVVDPVMVATSGARLISEDAIETLKAELFPLAKILTPNIPETEELTGMKITSAADMEAAAKKISETYHCAVLCKGGHKLNDANDLLWSEGKGRWFSGKRIDNPNTHGTGCTLSSAIASNLAKGFDLETSVERAKDYISGALAAMLDLGKGSGPMDHGFAIDNEYTREAK